MIPPWSILAEGGHACRVGRDPLDWLPMDPLDRPRSLLGGICCSACSEHVPPDQIRILAERQDLAFVEIECPACGSTSLGLLVADADDVPAIPSAVDLAAGRPSPATAITSDDVLGMHLLLDGWGGDLAGLLDPRPDRGPSGLPR